jgi:hypothetical protein
VSVCHRCVNSWLICSISLIYSRYLLTLFFSFFPLPFPFSPRVFSSRFVLSLSIPRWLQARILSRAPMRSSCYFLPHREGNALTLTRHFSLYLQIRHRPPQIADLLTAGNYPRRCARDENHCTVRGMTRLP